MLYLMCYLVLAAGIMAMVLNLVLPQEQEEPSKGEDDDVSDDAHVVRMEERIPESKEVHSS